MKNTPHVYLMLFFTALLLLVSNTAGFAQDSASEPPPLKTPPQEINLLESLEKSLASEQENMTQLESRLQRAQKFEKEISTEFNAYKIQLSAYNGILLASEIPIDELETIRLNTRTALEYIALRLKELTGDRNLLDQARLQIEEQYAVNQKQLSEITSEAPKKSSMGSETKVLVETLQALTDLLSEERKILEQAQLLYTGLIENLEEIQHDFTLLAEKFETHIDERKKRELFERKANPFTLLTRSQLTLEFKQLIEQTQRVLSPQFWREMFLTLWNSEGYILLRVLLFLAIAISLLIRFRRFFIRQIDRIACDELPWRCLMLHVWQRSLLLLGITVVLYAYEEQMRLAHSAVTLSQVLVRILMVLLFSSWVFDFLAFRAEKRGALEPPARVLFHLRLCIRVIRVFTIFYVFVEWTLGSSGAVLLLARLIFELLFFIWSIPFWEIFREQPQPIFPGQARTRQILRSLSAGLGFILAGGGLLIELAGFGLLARYWYLSWGRSFVVGLWALIIFQTLREWDLGVSKISLKDQDQTVKTAHQMRWLLVRLSWFACPILAVIGFLFAWGAKHIVIVGAFEVLTSPVPIGGIDLSLLGILYAFFILVFTHVAIRFWRRMLREKILINSGLDFGVQESVVTISAYLFWLFGILWALNALGVGTTSLAVGFGALGIGLGFGLQSIFNNFISGVILLFDRAVEVGDVLEINGTWGFIEKINVRSTVVRTYDNSALIIPNADIMSNQLTNWTFRDMRVRRTIKIGVAYGTDVRLVEKTLYEIAESHARVLTEPAPMVLFTELGESSLNFVLRVWTLLDYGVTTENDIRYEIVRVFREKQIEIPFPQRDLHIRSTPESRLSELNGLPDDEI